MPTLWCVCVFIFLFHWLCLLVPTEAYSCTFLLALLMRCACWTPRLRFMVKTFARPPEMLSSYSWGTLWGEITWRWGRGRSAIWLSLLFLLFMNDSVCFLRVTVLDRATDFLFFLGKLLIVGLVGESVCHTFIPPRYLGLNLLMISCQSSYLYNGDQRMQYISNLFMYTVP